MSDKQKTPVPGQPPISGQPVNVGELVGKTKPKERRFRLTLLIIGVVVIIVAAFYMIYGRSGGRFTHETLETPMGVALKVTINVDNMTPIAQEDGDIYIVKLFSDNEGTRSSFELMRQVIPYQAGKSEIEVTFLPQAHPQKIATNNVSVTIDYSPDEKSSATYVYTLTNAEFVSSYNEKALQLIALMDGYDVVKQGDSDVKRVDDMAQYLTDKNAEWYRSYMESQSLPMEKHVGEKIAFDLELIDYYKKGPDSVLGAYLFQYAARSKSPEEIADLIKKGYAGQRQEKYQTLLLFKDRNTYDRLTSGRTTENAKEEVLHDNARYTEWYNSLSTYTVYGYYMGNNYIYCTDIVPAK
ncbi:hypothetical protein LJB83_02720 [Clostridia bacterium OttesenSCG-928-F22]|nr:hypothetical protein [Clostridia bacterium OttesenSCG-928-F22]